MSIRRVLVLMAALGAFCSVGAAVACSCATQSLARRYEASDNVFTALITGGEVERAPDRRRNTVHMRFEVLDRFKGEIPFDALHSTGLGGMCGRSLDVGVTYLVFVPNTGRIGTCSGIQALDGEQGSWGRPALAALEAHRRGAGPVAEPWYFAGDGRRCMLRTMLDLPGYPNPSTLVMEHDRTSAEDLTRRTVLWVSLASARENQAGYPLSLVVGDSQWLVSWREQHLGRTPRYELQGPAALALAQALQAPQQDTLRLSFAHPHHGHVEQTLRTAHAREALGQFAECVAASQAAP